MFHRSRPSSQRAGAAGESPPRGTRRAASIDARERGRRASEMTFGSDEFRAKTTEDDRAFDDAATEAVRKQMEFYFCDSNLPRDAFLLEEVARAKRDGFDGAVDIAMIAGFSRMRDIVAPYGGKDNAKNVERIAKALETSELLEVVQGTRVKRKSLKVGDLDEPDLTTEEGVNAYRSAMVAELDKRFVFASPFSREATIEELTKFFETVGKVQSIRMRRHTASKDFRGSVFVEFASEEEARAIAGRTDVTYAGATLTLSTKSDYMAQKKKEQVEKKEKARAEAIARGEDPDNIPPQPEPVFVGKMPEKGSEREDRGGRGRGGPDRGGQRFDGGKPNGDKPRFGRPY